MLHWNGSAFTDSTTTFEQHWVLGISAAGANAWFGAAETDALRYDGAQWHRDFISSGAELDCVWALSATSAFAAGYSGDIVQWNGTGWSNANMNVTNPGGWYSMHGSSASDGWVVGSGGSSAHWNGTIWSDANIPTTAYLYSVYAISPTNAYAVGTDGVFHWDGNAWTHDTRV